MRESTRKLLPLMQKFYARGMGVHMIGRIVGRDGKTVLRALREIGINTSARPANGSHRRVDVCECGEPALAVGSRCKAHAREYQREILRAYRERMR